MPTDPLTPDQVDALLRPDPRTTAADLLVLRDALRRLGDAWERLALAAGQLEDVARALEGRRAGPAVGTPPADAERPRPLPPRAD
jgi:hypothetical protein